MEPVHLKLKDPPVDAGVPELEGVRVGTAPPDPLDPGLAAPLAVPLLGLALVVEPPAEGRGGEKKGTWCQWGTCAVGCVYNRQETQGGRDFKTNAVGCCCTRHQILLCPNLGSRMLLCGHQ
jgi:hypothetical protein